MSQTTIRERLAHSYRDWIHTTTLSQCTPGVDECPDWSLAYDLADRALKVIGPLATMSDEEAEILSSYFKTQSEKHYAESERYERMRTAWEGMAVALRLPER